MYVLVFPIQAVIALSQFNQIFRTNLWARERRDVVGVNCLKEQWKHRCKAKDGQEEYDNNNMTFI